MNFLLGFSPSNNIANIFTYVISFFYIFISKKTKGALTVKSQELPGLWNGAMAEWITLFVEVPLATFNPVKTVNDLLRDQHQ